VVIQYVIFEEKIDTNNIPFIISLGTLEASDLDDAKRQLKSNFKEIVDPSYRGGNIILCPKTSFTNIRKIGTGDWIE